MMTVAFQAMHENGILYHMKVHVDFLLQQFAHRRQQILDPFAASHSACALSTTLWNFQKHSAKSIELPFLNLNPSWMYLHQ